MPELTRCDCGLTTGSKEGVCEGCDTLLPPPSADWLYDKEQRRQWTIDHATGSVRRSVRDQSRQQTN